MGVSLERPSVRSAAFPRVRRYLARLPHGLDSYPECTARASVHRAFTESCSLRGFAWGQLQPELATLLRSRIAPDAWVSQVASLALVLAVADHLQLDDERAVTWFRDCNLSMLSSSAYSSQLSLASPHELVQRGAARWAMLHRGVGFGVVSRERGADATVTFPPYLYDDLLLRGQGDGFRTALAMSNAHDCTYQIVRATPRSCEYRFDWT